MARREDTTRPDFEFCVTGSPVSARARNSLLLRKWTAAVADAARAAWPERQPPLQGAVSLRVTHYADRRIAERDHMIKPIEASLHGIAIADDRQISDALWNWRDISGRFTVGFVSMSLAAALSDGGEFLHIRLWNRLMPPDDQDGERRARKRLARKYRSLGYDVLEQPAPDLLPAFMRDLAPDIIARNGSDNVVIAVKRNAALKGSNDLVHIAALVSGQPDWRLELVVLDDTDIDQAADADIDLDGVTAKVTAAIKAGMSDVAYVYLAGIVVRTAHDLAEIHRIRSDNKSDQDLLADLASRGVIPPALLQQCLVVLAARDGLVQAFDDAQQASEEALEGVFYLCEQLLAGVALSRRHRS